MIGNVSLNCTPLGQDYKFNNKLNTNLAFGNSKEAEEAQDGYETQAVEAENNIEDQPKQVEQQKKPNVLKRVVNHFKGMSWKNVKENFKDGLMSPISQILDHPIEAAGGLVIGGIAFKEVTKYIPKFPIFAVALTSAFGAFNIGKGAYKLAKAKDTETKEKSFYDVGKGTFYSAVSVVAANKVAVSQKFENITPKSNYFKPLLECWKRTIQSAKQAFTGDWKLAAGITTPGAIDTINHEPANQPDNSVDQAVNIDKGRITDKDSTIGRLVDGIEKAADSENAMAALKAERDSNNN
ncbi:MAG: hypothetical protein A2Y25_06345 [Candidatus Melainabacteria bacterium GWF2_37_15]|nr:MAG: hypothetical protein A2Y25_06345 [Candidatus Melainabacteria bacterium GWF2_37_15]